MGALREEQRVGLDYLAAVTALLRRTRTAHPTKGLYEAAEVLWWWGEVARSTDLIGQLFWFDDDGQPEAAVIVNAWRDHTSLDPMVMPDSTPEWVAHVIDRGLAHAAESGLDVIQLEVDRADTVLREVLFDRGFVIDEEDGGVVESWMRADDRPEISPLRDGYRLSSRGGAMQYPHHMIARHTPAVEQRLRQTPLYRPDLDLVVYDRDDEVAAYGMFWYDPETRVGVVEPMRTEDDHQQRGLARHLLTSGISRLVEAGAERIKICFEPGNPASSHLYVSVGFEPVKQTDVFVSR